ncbi:MAG: class I SAM-dependent methyltransferase [Rhodobacteraceae bacterium]|nr:class I SAM-dependent methyltransferase [Paracoccaceae bacterium]MBR9823257.1 class I SAM-dependent methyltransferase [Paracoccaceae bacterium]
MASLNRIAMRKTSRRWIQELDPPRLQVAEISGKWGRQFDFASYERFLYPAHDICEGPVRDEAGQSRQFDLVIADQVWEHLDRPYAATRNVLEMLRPGGWFYIATPFCVPFHGAPVDCSRWSARGLKNLLIEAGFPKATIRARQWGNRAAARRNIEAHEAGAWPPAYDRASDDLTNDPDFPIISWAMARK